MLSNIDLANALSIERLTHIVDVGALIIEEKPPYQSLVDAELCHVTGFDPQGKSCLPYAIGDGKEHTLYTCAYPGWTSLFKPCESTLEVFDFFKNNARVIRKEVIQTHRLDDLDEVIHVDFLKVDAQGSELAILQHGRKKLADAVAVQVEMQFVNLYEEQPCLGEVDQELRYQGFIPHTLTSFKKCQGNQLIEANLVYVKDFIHSDSISDEQLKHLCLIVHSCYRSFDLANYCIELLKKRNAIYLNQELAQKVFNGSYI